jgi:hypothetical protein
MLQAVAERGAEQPGDQLAHLSRGERGELDDRLRRPGHERRPRLGPVREQKHQRPVSELIGHVAQQIHRRGVRPVQVLDEDHQGLVLEAPLDQGARGQRDLTPELFGLDVGARALLHPEHVAQDGRDGLRLLVPRAQRAETGGQLLPGDVERVGGIDLVRLPKERSEEAVGRLAQGRARGPAHGRAGEASVGVEPRQQLGDEP